MQLPAGWVRGRGLFTESFCLPVNVKTDLEEEDPAADGRGEDRPAAHEEVARVVTDHVVHGEPEPSEQIFM